MQICWFCLRKFHSKTMFKFHLLNEHGVFANVSDLQNFANNNDDVSEERSSSGEISQDRHDVDGGSSHDITEDRNSLDNVSGETCNSTDDVIGGRYSLPDIRKGGFENVIERRSTIKKVVGGRLKIVDITTREFFVKVEKTEHQNPKTVGSEFAPIKGNQKLTNLRPFNRYHPYNESAKFESSVVQDQRGNSACWTFATESDQPDIADQQNAADQPYELNLQFESNYLDRSNQPEESKQPEETDRQGRTDQPAETDKVHEPEKSTQLFKPDQQISKQLFSLGSSTEPHNCEICMEKFECRRSMVRHKQTAHQLALFECEVCHKTYTSKQNKNFHFDAVHNGANNFECTTCGKKFVWQNALAHHINITSHSSQKVRKQPPGPQKRKGSSTEPHNCEICMEKFESRKSMIRHKRTAHQLALFECEVCHKTYTSKQNKKFHFDAVHRGVKNFDCKICGKKFAWQNALADHMKSNSHSETKKFKCEYCDEEFKFKMEIAKHRVAVHSKNEMFKCKICDKDFISKVIRRNHMKVVHCGTNRFECKICSRTFSWEYSLKNHVTTAHAQTKSLKCDEEFDN